MKGLAMRKINALVIMTLTVGVGLQILNDIGDESSQEISIDQFYPAIDYPYCSGFETKQEINQRELNKMLFYRLNGNCQIQAQIVTSDFVLERNILNEKLRDMGLKDSDGDLYLYYRDACDEATNLDLNGVKVGKKEQRILFQKGEEIKIKGTRNQVTIC